MNDWKFSSLYENRKKRRFFCRFIVLVRRVWQSQDNEKCQRTKDKDKKCYQRWWSSAKTYNSNINVNVDDRSGKTRQNILFEVSSQIFSLNWLTQHFPVWIYDTCINQNSKLKETSSIMEEIVWSNHQGFLTTPSWRPLRRSPMEGLWTVTTWEKMSVKEQKMQKKVKLQSERIEGILTVST